MFERFTDRARRVVVLAQEEAKATGSSWILVSHLILGLAGEGEGIGAKALAALDFDVAGLRKTIPVIAAYPPPVHLPFTLEAKKSLELGLREALQLGHNFIGTEHVALGIARQCKNDPATVEELAPWVDPDALRESVMALLRAFPPQLAPVDIKTRVRSVLSPRVARVLLDETVAAVLEVVAPSPTEET